MAFGVDLAGATKVSVELSVDDEWQQRFLHRDRRLPINQGT